MRKIFNLVNNSLVPPQRGQYLDSINPATGEIEVLVPDSTTEDVDAAVEAAVKAFESWSKTSVEFRSEILFRIADLISKNLDELAMAESKDNGKPLSLSRSVDIPRAVHNFKFFASAILNTKTTARENNQFLNYTVKTPVGVAALISPWNLPLYLLTWKIAPAIAYGCTCVCKPSEFTSWTASILCSIIIEAGVPPGVVNMVFGNGFNAGAPLVSHPKVPLVSFTGGTATGEIIYRSCATLNKKMSLELGGKNACIVFEDFDFNDEDAINVITRSCFLNQGQICLCASRIYVHSSIYPRFLDVLKDRAEKIKVGDPFDSNSNMGPLISSQHLQKVLSFIEIAQNEGGKVVTGGERVLNGVNPKGYYLSPTLITGVHPIDCRIQQEEVFGPVVTITPFSDEEEVINWANGTKYGLSASIWTQNIKRAHRVAREMHGGTVWVNCWLVRDLNMPFGGVKASGLGREGNEYSCDFFCDEKTICMKL